MFRGKVKVDRFLQERVQYESPEFPIISRADVFDEFIDGEFSCHWHEDIEFTIVVQGEVEFRIHQASKEQQIKILKAGDGAFINAKTMHSARQVVPESIAYYFVIPARIFQMQASDLIYRKYVLPVIERPVAGLYLEKRKSGGLGAFGCSWKIFQSQRIGRVGIGNHGKSLRRLEKPVEETEPGQRGGKPFPSKKEAGIPGKENAGIYP